MVWRFLHRQPLPFTQMKLGNIMGARAQAHHPDFLLPPLGSRVPELMVFLELEFGI